MIFDDEKNLTPIRPKRRPDNLWMQKERIYVPCPLSVKNQFTRVANSLGMSQAELGIVVVQGVLASPVFLQVFLNDYERLNDGKKQTKADQ